MHNRKALASRLLLVYFLLFLIFFLILGDSVVEELIRNFVYKRESPTVVSFDDQYLTISLRLCLKMLLLVNFLALSLLIKN